MAHRLNIPKIKVSDHQIKAILDSTFSSGTIVEIEYAIINYTSSNLTDVSEHLRKFAPSKRVPLEIKLKFKHPHLAKKPVRFEYRFCDTAENSYVLAHTTKKSMSQILDKSIKEINTYRRVRSELFVAALFLVALGASYYIPYNVFKSESVLISCTTIVGFTYLHFLPHCYIKLSQLDFIQNLTKVSFDTRKVTYFLIVILSYLGILFLVDLRTTEELYSTPYIQKKIVKKLEIKSIDREVESISIAIDEYDKLKDDSKSRKAYVAQMIVHMSRLLGENGIFNSVPISNINIFVDSSTPSGKRNNLILKNHLLSTKIRKHAHGEVDVLHEARISTSFRNTRQVDFENWLHTVVIDDKHSISWTRKDLLEQMKTDYVDIDIASVTSEDFDKMKSSSPGSLRSYSGNKTFPPKNESYEESIRAMAQELVETWQNYKALIIQQ